jgi:hypothetical protein
VVLYGECVGRPKDGGSSPDRAGDVEAEEELRLDGALMTTVASGGPRQSVREVSEGRGFGEESLEGRCTEEREESGSSYQIPMDDGAPVHGRATGMLAREGSAQLWWLRRGREENG